jgi:predicted metalloprotease
MRWQDLGESNNVDDLREDPGSSGGGGGGGGGRGFAMGGGTLVLLLVVYLIGGKQALFSVLQNGGGGGGQPVAAAHHELTPKEQETKKFASSILHSTEEIWTDEFQKMGRTYELPRMELFTGGVRSGCGQASAQMGPFYCPADHKVYIDLTFFDEMEQRFHATGDFAKAYVIAHEVGHHVQNLMGISAQVDEAERKTTRTQANQLSVRLELQADFLAGMWARKGQEKFKFIEDGDIESAINAANAIGDDTLQKEAQGRVVPDSFTHGTSAQRVKWFKLGLNSDHFDPGNNTFQVQAKDL